MPSQTFGHTASTRADSGVVWEALQDPETWRSIGPLDEVTAATSDADGLAGFEWSARAGGRPYSGTARRTGVAPGERIVLALDSSEMSGWIRAEVASEGQGSALTVTMHARGDGFLASMFWGSIAAALERGLRAQVEALAERLG
jgi:carbon monoxide dehydrogenase subunit G